MSMDPSYAGEETSPMGRSRVSSLADTPPGFPAGIPVRRTTYRNWAGTVAADDVFVCEPHTAQEVVVLANWARSFGFRVRASGRSHNFSPLVVTSSRKSPIPGEGSRILLVDTTAHLTKMRIESTNPPTVRVGVGATMDELLAYLEDHGYGLAAMPAAGDLSVGGVLAVGAHGTGFLGEGQRVLPGHGLASMSNLVLSLTAVVWDATACRYVLRTFDRSSPDCAAFLTHLGRAFLTEVTLRVGNDFALRCITDTTIPADELFAAPGAPARRSLAAMAAQASRVEAVLFSYTEHTYLRTWTVPTMRPTCSRPAVRPYNYAFTDNMPRELSDVVAAVMTDSPERAPELSALQFASTVAGLAATGSADITGPSKNVLLYVRPGVLRYTTNGYAICTRRCDIQRVVHDFTSFYRTRLAEYRAQGLHPINGPVEIRITGLDDAGVVDVPDACPPALSPVAPDPQHPEWDVAVWICVLTLPGTPHAAAFLRDIEGFLLSHFRAPYAGARVEWSKDWAYGPSGPWTDEAVLGEAIPRSFGSAWDWARRRLAAHDPHRIFGNELLDRLL